MNFELPFNWTDVAVVVFLILGIIRGRKHGFSQEIIIVIQWIMIVFACAFLYDPLGHLLASMANFSLLFSFIVCYLSVAIVIKLIFVIIKSLASGKLVGSDVFGTAEYPLGVVAGLIRYACMVIFAMALLDAKLVPEAQAKATVASQVELYGKDYFFRLEKIQAQVFQESLIGHFVKDNLSSFLIEPTAPEAKEIHQKEWTPLP